jgi:NADH dehydrogenase/NADH:ubiquinone oxidoreductase subunit G
MLGGPTATLEELATKSGPAAKLANGGGGWIVGGYLSNWSTNLKLPSGFKVVQDILDSDLAFNADVVLPSAAWAEKDGCWENYAGKIQAFAEAVPPPEGAQRDGLVYLRLLGRSGQYNASEIRNEMAGPFPSVHLPTEKADAPAFEFAAL